MSEENPSPNRCVLVIPDEGDPLGLLSTGVCGSRPPVVHKWGCGCGARARWYPNLNYISKCEECGDWLSLVGVSALVMAWKGEILPEGVQRAAQCLKMPGGELFGHAHWLLAPAPPTELPSKLGTIITNEGV